MGDRTADDKRRIGVVLVHGVGDPPLGRIRALAEQQLARVGVDAIREVNWNVLVHKRLKQHNRLAGRHFVGLLGEALHHAALIAPSVPLPGAFSRVMLVLVRGLGTLAQLVPLAVLMAGVLMATGFATASLWILGSIGMLWCLAMALAALTFDRLAMAGAFRMCTLPFLWLPIYLGCLPAVVNWLVWVPVLAIALIIPRWLSPSELPIIGKHFGGDFGDGVRGMAVALTVFLSGIVVAAVVMWVVKRVTTLPMKVLSDILHYLGRPTYRARLCLQVRSACDELASAGCTDLLLLTHSLGTVIAIDTLRAGVALERFESTVLVTSGSPLRRFFHRFFSAWYGDPGTQERAFRATCPRFNWVNVYRPYDPIGTRIGLAGDREICSEQRELGVLRAHNDYWSDPVIYRLVSPIIARFISEPPGMKPIGPVPRQPEPPRMHPIPKPWRWGSRLATASIVVAAAAFIVDETIRPGLQDQLDYQQLQRAGTEVDGELREERNTYYYNYGESWEWSGPLPVRRSGLIVSERLLERLPADARDLYRYAVESGERRVYVKKSVSFTPRGQTEAISPESNYALVDLGSELVPETIGLFRPDATKDFVTTSPVRVRYVADDPSVYTVLGLERRPASISSQVPSVLVRFGVLLLVIRGLWGMLFMPVVVPLFGRHTVPSSTAGWLLPAFLVLIGLVSYSFL